MAVIRGSQARVALFQRLGAAPPGAQALGPAKSGPGQAEGTNPAASPVLDRILERPDEALKTPDGFAISDPPEWLWTENKSVPPLRDSKAYRESDHITRLSPAESRDLAPEDRKAYDKSSADVTMKGGTTSGVVYPLAVCEIARSFHLNVGGASAGALAAGLAAAAETGRQEQDRQRQEQRRQDLEEPSFDPERRENGHVRPGFVGLADAMAWLCELDDEPDGLLRSKERYRLGRMFQANGPGRPLFGVAVAVMRRRWWLVPVRFVLSTGWRSVTGSILVTAASGWAVVASSPQAGATSMPTVLSVLAAIGAIIALLVALVGGLAALVAIGALVVRGIRAVVRGPWSDQRQGPDGDPVKDEPRRPVRRLAKIALVGLVTAAAAGLVAWWLTDAADLLWVAVVGGMLAYVLLVTVALAAGLWHVMRTAGDHGFGLIPGAEPSEAEIDDASRPLLCWLSDTLSELAGLERGEILRFGHLWWGAGYDPQSPPDDHATTTMMDDPRSRLVNLELVTSEVVQGRAYRFPLATAEELKERDGSALYLDLSDLDKGPHLVPAAVRTVLKARHAEQLMATDIRTKKQVTLVPLPDPRDLPVVFAMRLSMSLPGLFQAVSMYRVVASGDVRDEFGRTLTKNGVEVRYPPEPSVGKATWCERLWFTDGGVTSNFPIHFFDSPLPRWPTFGVSLSKHPPGYRSQDVWLPQDWDLKSAPTGIFGSNLAAFLGSIVNTARGWRDNEQMFMPGCRGRIAWVRQLSDEGGANLYMPRDRVASMCLRGVVAGARLRRRFESSEYRERAQWIRMRAALANLDELARTVADALEGEPYPGFASGTPLATLPGDPENENARLRLNLPPVPTYLVADRDKKEYWMAVRGLLEPLRTYATARRGAGAAPVDGVLSRNTPKPAPELRQVPRI
ncbi:hypothetical protein HP550_20415 [Cellulomonas humilata]|uniref:PNPLA domain-containing protein n=1 Tax=Cellulomonas humilata TaxID=144055 RepID=A0A7Y6DZL6_9CELL|nr:patatin-like phospholipase family protein [Cellulomonas humilata]NUU19615.1 hypothetical protein [Cellulomonas humilata]